MKKDILLGTILLITGAMAEDIPTLFSCGPGKVRPLESYTCSEETWVPPCGVGEYESVDPFNIGDDSAYNNGIQVRDAFRLRECTPCLAGTYKASVDVESTTDGYAANEACEPATDGSVVTSAGQSQQTECQAGTYAKTKSEECVAATDGSVVTSAGQTSEVECQAGTYAKTKSEECVAATDGSVVTSAGQTSEVECQAGTYAKTKSEECVAATDGSVVTSAGQTSEVECQAGTYAKNKNEACATFTLANATQYITNYADTSSTGSSTDRLFATLNICVSGTYESNFNARFTNGLPILDRTCGQCVQDGDYVEATSQVFLPIKEVCELGNTATDICGNDIEAVVCKASDGGAVATISTIADCRPGYYVKRDADGFDSCEQCVKALNPNNGLPYNSLFPYLCNSAVAVKPLEAHCDFVTVDGVSTATQYITDYAIGANNRFVGCEDFTECGDQKSEVSAPGAQWDRVCECRKDLVIGAETVACESDTHGVITEPVHALTCAEGFIVNERDCGIGYTDKACDNCVFDFGTVPTASSDRCHFRKLDELFEFDYTLDHSSDTPDAENDISLGNSLLEVRETQKTLLKIKMLATIKNYADAAVNANKNYNYFQYDIQTSKWEQIPTSTNGVLLTHTYCYIKPSYIRTDGKYVKQTVNVPADCDDHEEVHLFKQLDDEVEAGSKTWAQSTSDYSFYAVNGYTIDKAYEIQVAHKLIGVASTCGVGSSSNAIDDIFAWTDLKGQASDSVTFNFAPANLNADIGSGVTFTNAFSVNVLTQARPTITVHDLLYVSGEIASVKFQATGAAASSIDFTMGTGDVGVQHHGNYHVAGTLTVNCGATLEIDANDASYHCFDSTGTYTEPDSNGVFTDHVGVLSPCTAQLSTSCTAAMSIPFKIVDARKCYNNHGDTPCDPADLLLKPGGGSYEQPSETDTSYTITSNSVIVEAIRLNNERKIPGGEDATVATFSGKAVSDEQTFQCDNVQCSRDPYILLARGTGDTSFQVDIAWNGQGSSTSGCTDPSTDADKDCVSPTEIAATVTGLGTKTTDTGETTLVLPGLNYPQFYVYGLATFETSESSTSIHSIIDPTAPDQDTDTFDTPYTRRLGAPRESSVNSQTIVVVGPQTVVSA